MSTTNEQTKSREPIIINRASDFTDALNALGKGVFTIPVIGTQNHNPDNVWIGEEFFNQLKDNSSTSKKAYIEFNGNICVIDVECVVIPSISISTADIISANDVVKDN